MRLSSSLGRPSDARAASAALEGSRAMAERITADLRGSMCDVSDKMDAIDAVVAGLEDENARLRELCAENERLRQENQSIGMAAYELGRSSLADENAKLLELGGFMLRCISQYYHCADCLVNGECCEISYIEADALELGIEVSE